MESTSPIGLGEVFHTLFSNMVANPTQVIISSNYISILFWSVVLCLCLKAVASKKTLNVISDVISKSIAYVISFAPFGILGLEYEAVRANGLEIFTVYGIIILVLVGAVLFASLIVNPFIIFLKLKRNPYPLVFTCSRESGITAFFTRS